MSDPRPATMDPLDAPLWQGYDYYQSLADGVRKASYQHTFWVDPKHWERHLPADWVFQLHWNSYRYHEIDSLQKLRAVAKENVPGVYIFSVCPELRVSEFPAYVLYVGISNVNDSGRYLWQRLAEYLPTRISSIKKRKNIHTMICLYFRMLWVHFAYVNESSAALMLAETKLHGYLAPPVGDSAYPVDMKPLKPAFP